MKKQAAEEDFIDGQGPLTKDEIDGLMQYFSKVKNTESKAVTSEKENVNAPTQAAQE